MYNTAIELPSLPSGLEFLMNRYGSHNINMELLEIQSPSRPNLTLSGVIGREDGDVTRPIFATLADMKHYWRGIVHSSEAASYIYMDLRVLASATDTFQKLSSKFKEQVKYFSVKIELESAEDSALLLRPISVNLEQIARGDQMEWGLGFSLEIYTSWSEELSEVMFLEGNTPAKILGLPVATHLYSAR